MPIVFIRKDICDKLNMIKQKYGYKTVSDVIAVAIDGKTEQQIQTLNKLKARLDRLEEFVAKASGGQFEPE